MVRTRSQAVIFKWDYFGSADGATACWSEREEFSSLQWCNPNTVFPLAAGVVAAVVPWRWDQCCWVNDRVAWLRFHSARKGHRWGFLSELGHHNTLPSCPAVSVHVSLASWWLWMKNNVFFQTWGAFRILKQTPARLQLIFTCSWTREPLLVFLSSVCV